MKRKFDNRSHLVDYLRQEFAEVLEDSAVSPLRGGRRAALELLQQIEPKDYASSRNHLNGKVSRLSPYLRHGVVTLAEVRSYALSQVSHPEDAAKFLNQLAWREYWQRLYRLLGTRIWPDVEPYKTGHAASDYAAQLPEDVEQGRSGLACMDAFSRQLIETGYLHNHARMWLAAYLVHWRKVRWQAGARWFLRHLLDGDPASNNLSWQWVASTFSHKPYFFNRENLERYSRGKFCSGCRLHRDCPLDRRYDQLAGQLFKVGNGPPPSAPPLEAWQDRKPGSTSSGSSLFWMHGDGLRQASSAPAIFIFDLAVLRHYRISLKRLVFLYECLLELQVEIVRGSVVSKLQQRLARGHFDQVVTTDSPAPGFAKIGQQLQHFTRLVVVEEPPFMKEPAGSLDLTRFSRFWRRVQASVMEA